MRFLAALAATVLSLAAPSSSSAQAVAGETLVMPFVNRQTDPKLYWLGEGSAVLLSELIERYGGVAVPREERLSAFAGLQLPPAAALSHATVIKVGYFVGAADVIVGSYELVGEHLTVRARVIRLEAGRLTPEVIERGTLADLFGVYDRTARRLREGATAAPPAGMGTLLATLQGFEAYVKGVVAEVPATQRAFLEQAGKAAPADDRVRLALWRVHTDAGDHALAFESVTMASRSGPHARVARYLSALSLIDLKRYEEAFGILKALQSEAGSAEVLNAIGIVQLRRGSTPQTGRAAYYFSQASQTDPTDADYFFNLGYAYWTDKDAPAAIYWLREAVRRNPADGDAHFILAAALQQTGAPAEAARERELAQRLSSSYDNARQVNGDPVPRGLERVKEHLERPSSRVDSIITATGQRDQAELAAFHLAAGRRAFGRDADREAEQELRRALYLSPYLSDAHLLLGRIHLRTGRTPEAIQAFKIALWSEETVAGRLALAEAYLQGQNPAAAKEEVERALVIDPGSVEARALREKLTKAPKGASMLRSTLESAT
ncbi:MAG TPA: tetratricopeptide repeat protein [Vicinamibacterales bacterium]|nr:tetratricopeptide repeat protein [Vicinamibacterales bacterium]